MEYSICIPTYRRPVLLLDLLQSVARQRSTFDLSTCEVVIVDNEPDGEGLRAVSQHPFPFSIVTGFLQSPSVPNARNRCLELARGKHIIMFDDDQLLPEGWLKGITTAYRNSSGKWDGTVSSVVPRFESALAWPLPLAKIYNRRRLPTGTRITLRDARTGGAIVGRHVFEKLAPAFDGRLHQVGGEDSDFFERAIANGFSFFSYDEIPIIERYPPERCSLRFIARANLKIGYAVSLRERNARGGSSLSSSIRRLALSSAGFLACLPLLLAAPPLGLKAFEFGIRNWGRWRGGRGRQMKYYGSSA